MKQLLLFLALSLPFSTALAQNQEKPATETVYTFVEQMPEFPGGQSKMMEYLAQNIQYPQEAIMKNQEGTVFLKFVVDKTGQLTQTEVLKSAAPSLDAEAIRVCQTMPRWQPGKQNGQVVAVKYTLPVRFQIGRQKSGLMSSAYAEVAPEFPGGKQALIYFLADNIRYPVQRLHKMVEGKVVVSFTVQENGELLDPKVESGPDAALNAEALRLVKAMPAWQPALKGNKAIAVRHAVEIPFTTDMPLNYEDLPADSIKKEADLEVQAEFPGGLEGMMRYLGTNIKYPQDAIVQGIEGRTVLSFVVDHQGRVRNIKTLKSIFPSMDAEARRVVRTMPRWKPGIMKGKPVNVLFTLPVSFSMSDKTKTDSSSVTEKVDQQPEFPGGMKALRKFLERNMKYPTEALSANAHGEVRISFIINEDGSLSDYKVLKTIGYGTEKEAIRVLQKMPRWIPGKQNGKLVRVLYSLPFRF